MARATFPDSDTCVSCWGIVPPEGVSMVPDDGELCSCDGEDYLAEYEANTYRSGNGYVIEWYHNDVGQVTEKYFDTIGAAHEWYATNGYEDYSS